MIDRNEIMRNSRIASSVERYHTWPKISRQTVAEHSYHILRIWYYVWGPIPTVVATHAIFHDIGEMATGDLPYPIKKVWRQLKEVTTVIEEHYVHDTLGLKLPLLDFDQKQRFKICDLIEMLEYGLIETHMGNRLAEPIVVDVANNIKDLLRDRPKEDKQAVKDYLANYWNFSLGTPEETEHASFTSL